MKTIKNEYTTKKFTITPETLERFEIMENRRQIGQSHVSKIHGCMLRGKNPLGVIVVNERNNKWRLIDGNHRIEAVKKFYGYRKQNREVRIECIVRIYKGLSNDEERELYSDEARRRNESHDDRLTLYRDTITFYKLTQEKRYEFPCNVSISNQKNSLRFRIILDALATVKSEMRNGYVPSYPNKEEIIGFARELTYDDFIIVKRFVHLFQKVFGNVGKGNPFTRRQGFVPLFDIFYKNLMNTKDDEVIKRFQLVLGKSDVMMYLNMQGREAQQTIRGLMVRYMNKGRVKRILV